MKLNSTIQLLLGVSMAVIFSYAAIASGEHDGPDKGSKMSAESMAGGHTGGEEDHEDGGGHEADSDEDHDAGGDHSHKNWVSPPAKFASLRYDGWDDANAARRGKALYTQQCAVCHGAQGKGDGPAAAGLPHPPANLTNNFHQLDGVGDGYLFWRLTEGGTVEPFKSLQSAMPAFGTQLSEQQRWDILTYVHREIHHGFKDQVQQTKQMMKKDKHS